MTDQGPNPPEKTLEMRVAELEDKLSQMHITEDEMKAFHKVSALLAGPNTAAAQNVSPGVVSGCTSCTNCTSCSGCISECAIAHCVIQCIIRQPIINQPIFNPIRQCIIRQCIIAPAECFDCAQGQPGAGTIGGQFGTLGG